VADRLVIVSFTSMKYRGSRLRDAPNFRPTFEEQGLISRMVRGLDKYHSHQNFRLLTQLLKILEFSHAELKYEFSTLFEN